MPEMPEVETIRRSLHFLVGRTVRSIRFSPLAPIETVTPRRLKDCLQDKQLQQLQRRGKYLLFRETQGTALVIHLGMTGQLRFFENDKNLPPHTHAIIEFVEGGVLTFVDPRRFGTLSLSQTKDGQDNPFLSRLGPDYDAEGFSETDFIQRSRRHAGLSLKSLALHQGVAAGLGNIYACEALYRAGLSPKRRVSRTKDAELIAFFHAAREALRIGIENGGSSLRDYLDGMGNRGVMKDFLLVYDREGKMTLDGRGRVKRIVQNARSTWYCPELQK